MNQVLFIAYYFPPLGGAGVQRTLKFAKYLREFGWQSIVLTVQPHTNYLSDMTLLTEVPTDINVFRTPAPILPTRLPWKARNWITRWLLAVDEQLGWLPFAVNKGKDILRSKQIDAIMSSSAPYTSHLIGRQLREFAQIPWLADFRDPWIGNFAMKYPTRWHRNLAAKLEHRVITSADLTLVVSEPMREAILNRYVSLPADQVITLSNGYDPADFVQHTPSPPQNAKFTITYTGSFYTDAISPGNFLTALRTCLDDRRIPYESIRVLMVGNHSSKIKDEVDNLDLSGIVQLTGYVHHTTSIAYLLQSDLQLLIIGTLPGSQAVLTGKIFEYLASNRPILALAPPGAASDLIREAKAGEVVTPNDIDGIARQLTSFYQQWEDGSLRSYSDPAIIQRFDRRLLTQKLAEILDNLVR